MEESISEIISIKRKNIDNIEAEIKEIKRLDKKYTDLQIFTDKFGKKIFTSRKVNPVIKECFFTHTFNHNGDGLLVTVWCWLQDEENCIYSNPAYIYVGETCIFSYRLKRIFKDWKECMKNNNFSNFMIEEISKRLEYF